MQKIAIAVNPQPSRQLNGGRPSRSQSTRTFHLGKRKLLFFLAMSFVAIFWFWRMDGYFPRVKGLCPQIQSFPTEAVPSYISEFSTYKVNFRTSDPALPKCYPGDVAAKAAALISTYSRDHPFFLQLSDYFWVKNEAFSQLPYGTSGHEELLMKLLALTNRYNVPPEIERLPCRRCVVVGNGFHLRNSSLGEVINKYDIVIRLNNAPVNEYQQDVGNKTTMRFFYPESADFNQSSDNNPDSLMVLVPFKPTDIQWMQAMIKHEKPVHVGFWKPPPLHWEVNAENVRILNPYFMEFAATKMLRSGQSQKTNIKVRPTMGMLAITFAMHFCDLVHIAGFGYPTSSNESKQPIHYYEHVMVQATTETDHNITLEAVAIKQLLQHRLIHNLMYF